MEHRVSPEIEPESDDETGTDRRRRFAQLVESPASRRLALPRLIVVGMTALAVVVLVGFGVWRFLRSATEFVDGQPENQIPISRIELVPAPDPWVKGGEKLILEEAHLAGKLDATIPILELNLNEVEKAFKLCPLVKDVIRVDRTHRGRLIVELAYRQPVAVVLIERATREAFVLDEEGVVLPPDEMAWASHVPPYRAEGMSVPLIKILGVPPSSPTPHFGLPWKRKVEGNDTKDDDPMVLGAARIARFLQVKRLALKSPGEAPDFVSIWLPQGPDEPFFLVDSGGNLVNWGKAPGEERPGEPDPEARWKMLLEWVRARGPLMAKHPNYLLFKSKGAELHYEPKPADKR